MVKATKEDNDGTTDSGDERDRNDENSKISSKCTHITKAVDFPKVKKFIKQNGFKTSCFECDKIKKDNPVGDDEEEEEYDKSLWMCLKCGYQFCGRSVNKHGIAHYEKAHSDMHAITVNTTSFNIWCYMCDDDIPEDSHKRLLECVSFVRKEAFKPPPIENVTNKMQAGIENIMPLLSDINNTSSTTTNKESTLPESSMSVFYNLSLSSNRKSQDANESSFTISNPSLLPRVRGLSNLGNTCFFNAVVQNLAQTPYLLEVLSDTIDSRSDFELPGGKCEIRKDEYIELNPVKGELTEAGVFTKTLHNTLDQLQRSGGVFTPRELLSQFTSKWPQFAGGDQHDSHEALRHLLESVRTEDLRRFQSVILRELGYNSKVDPKNVRDEDKIKIKFFGKRAEDRILGPEPVFRGYLVSTLTCQECNHISPRQEYFLDISLPVTNDKPQPPTRRKNSPEPTAISQQQPPIGPTKSQIKREKRAERKAKRNSKHQNRRVLQSNAFGDQVEMKSIESELQEMTVTTKPKDKDDDDVSTTSSQLSDSDADVEDNLTDEKQSIKKIVYDSNGNQYQNPEKIDDMPENPFKTEDGDNLKKGDNVGNIVCEASISSSGIASLSTQIAKIKVEKENTINDDDEREQAFKAQQKKCQQKHRERQLSHIDWSNTLSPRYQCSENELSLISCLNNFTSVELMTGSNKVGCEACTERINGKKGKTVYTNATKQFLISSPPAVLILHLKRFQVGMRGMFRKIPKHVTFPLVLDIAPFCASKVKLLQHVKRHQKKILYSLYGIVEHSGGMFGGHYVAYVKVRPKITRNDPRWEFLAQGTKAELDQLDEQKKVLEKQTEKVKKRQCSMNKDSDDSLSNTSSSQTSDDEDNAVGGSDEPKDAEKQPPPGKWYYVSDSHVREVTESEVLNAQAYLLFYERIF
ncbi:hypothetical protein PVAND_010955 [Polypedilum vanderplanki]|uniref:Ubiquitin carboxyl-terminal hydrolase n=1 Tax=Polypedilum vanderplanki TaxID=319348 RepID=A0A9J6CIH3_POLVA|nr:hypothetical protein PVAND_010955 [Polypedilum vanderplanki]